MGIKRPVAGMRFGLTHEFLRHVGFLGLFLAGRGRVIVLVWRFSALCRTGQGYMLSKPEALFWPDDLRVLSKKLGSHNIP